MIRVRFPMKVAIPTLVCALAACSGSSSSSGPDAGTGDATSEGSQGDATGGHESGPGDGGVVDGTVKDGPAGDAAAPDAPAETGTEAGGDAPSGSDAAVDGPTDAAVTSATSLCNASCAAGQKMCAGCVSTTDPYWGCADLTTCNPCSFPHADTKCDGNGACAIANCKPGYADCNGVASDGCEANLAAPGTCGSCGNSCPAGDVCTPTGCATSCTFPLTKCNGSCVDITSSTLDCGGCGNFCPDPDRGTATCTGSTCGVTCETGYTSCGALGCRDVTRDPFACGAGCTVCEQGVFTPPANVPACTAGACAYTCAPGWSDCGGCTLVRVDPANCGSCGHACRSSELCSNGQCVTQAQVTLASGLSQAEDVVVDGNTVFFTTLGDSSVRSVSTSGGSVTLLASGEATPFRLAADGTNLYWSSQAGGAIRYTREDGTGTPATFIAATVPYGVAVDGTYLYWQDQTGVYRAPKNGIGGSTKLSTSGSGGPCDDILVLYAGGLWFNSACDSVVIDLADGGFFGGAPYTGGGSFALGGGYLYYGTVRTPPAGRGGYLAVPGPGDSLSSELWPHWGTLGASGAGIAGDSCGAFYAPGGGLQVVERGQELGEVSGSVSAIVSRAPATVAALGKSTGRVTISNGYVYWTDRGTTAAANDGAVYRIALPE